MHSLSTLKIYHLQKANMTGYAADRAPTAFRTNWVIGSLEPEFSLGIPYLTCLSCVVAVPSKEVTFVLAVVYSFVASF